MYACSRGVARRLHRHRLLHQLVRLRLLVRLHQRVDVRPEHQRLTPVRHREIGLEPGRFAKRAPRLRVIERVGEIETLIHERLRVAIARRHREACANPGSADAARPHRPALSARRARRGGT